MREPNQTAPILLTTIPKAGTYFLAEILSEIGAHNRHLHVAKNHTENLLLYGEEVNKFTPSKAKVPLKLEQALYSIQEGEFVFGHIAKPLLNPFFLNRFRIIYSFRDHRAAMQAEFYWFREIRKDMQKKFTQYSNLSQQEHFLKYLEIFGPTRVRLFKFLDMWKNDPNVFVIDFDRFRKEPDYAESRIVELSKHIGIPVSAERAKQVLETCLNKDTKTKVKRDQSVNLWTPEAEKIYAKLLKKQKLYDKLYPMYWWLRARLRHCNQACA